jgi:hypothetical protein
MNIKSIIKFAITTTLILSSRLVLAIAPIITQDQEQVYGSQLMTQQEKTEIQSKMRAAKTSAEKEQIRKDNHLRMQERAKEQGVILSTRKPNRGSGRKLGLASTGLRVNEFDQRQVLPLNQAQQAHVLSEMRSLLAGTQAIIAALAADDMKAVAQHARPLGIGMKKKPENKLHGVLPEAFMMLGKSVHNDFDSIADDAESVKSSKHTLLQLSEMLKTCQVCHESYRIEISNKLGMKQRHGFGLGSMKGQK